MPRYLISFDDGWMTFPDEDLPDVARAAEEVVREAQEAGVWVYGAGLERQRASIVTTDGVVTDGPFPETRRSSAGSRSSTCPHAAKRSSGPPRSPSPAAARKRYGCSCPTRRGASRTSRRARSARRPEPAREGPARARRSRPKSHERLRAAHAALSRAPAFCETGASGQVSRHPPEARRGHPPRPRRACDRSQA
jgi:hypothetical protein